MQILSSSALANAAPNHGALALLNDAVKKGGATALASRWRPVRRIHPGLRGCGYDSRSTRRRLRETRGDDLRCSAGLDMIAIPGDSSVETIAGIIADDGWLASSITKTTAVRVIPAIGYNEGDA